MKYSIHNKGFTLVETLVAIAILMISIVGPLTVAQKSLNSSIYARDQVTASFLAQHVLETIKNIKSNHYNGPLTDICNGCTVVFPKKYTVDMSEVDDSGTSGYEIIKVTVSWNTGTILNSFTLEYNLFEDVIL